MSKTWPHCDPRVLHAPGTCEVCDEDPYLQEIRKVWSIAFSGEEAEENQLPCPSTLFRTENHINAWYGNRPVIDHSQVEFEWPPTEEEIATMKRLQSERDAHCSICGVKVGCWPIEIHRLATGCSGERITS